MLTRRGLVEHELRKRKEVIFSTFNFLNLTVTSRIRATPQRNLHYTERCRVDIIILWSVVNSDLYVQ